MLLIMDICLQLAAIILLLISMYLCNSDFVAPCQEVVYLYYPQSNWTNPMTCFGQQNTVEVIAYKFTALASRGLTGT